MKFLILDCETTCLKNDPKELDGNPFSPKNFLCYVGLLTHDCEYLDFDIEYSDEPYGEKLEKIQEVINAHDCLVGFNIKFDLHWLNRYGINTEKRIFDCQLVEFILGNQSSPYPSLNDTAIHYGFEGKLDVVKEQYWKRGLDTELVPKELLREYLKQDVLQTQKVFLHQDKIIPSSKRRLVSLQNQDLLTLLEIEKNGMLYDVETSKAKGDEIQGELNDIDKQLRVLSEFADFNTSSRDHISAIIFGGTIKLPVRESYIFTYKDGRTKEKQRWGTKEVTFPRLAEPPKNSELAKEGFYATNQDTLESIKLPSVHSRAHKIVSCLLRRAKLEKLRGTYLHGIPELMERMGWGNYIHGQLNQVVARTGRLSSSNPNLQNMDSSIGYLFKTRY